MPSDPYVWQQGLLEQRRPRRAQHPPLRPRVSSHSKWPVFWRTCCDRLQRVSSKQRSIFVCHLEGYGVERSEAGICLGCPPDMRSRPLGHAVAVWPGTPDTNALLPAPRGHHVARVHSGDRRTRFVRDTTIPRVPRAHTALAHSDPCVHVRKLDRAAYISFAVS